MIMFCCHYIYEDLNRACGLYEVAADDGLLQYIYIDPPTIHDSLGTLQTGHRIIVDGKQDVAISYADLGRRFAR